LSSYKIKLPGIIVVMDIISFPTNHLILVLFHPFSITASIHQQLNQDLSRIALALSSRRNLIPIPYSFKWIILESFSQHSYKLYSFTVFLGIQGTTSSSYPRALAVAILS
jgi:hypothetical protein